MTKVSPVHFIREVRQEINKIIWPTPKEVNRFTLVVFVAVFICAVFFVGIDQFFAWCIRLLFGLGG